MANQDMDWVKLRKQLQQRYTPKKHTLLKLDCKFFKIAYRGEGQFFYSYRSKGHIKTGIFSLHLPKFYFSLPSLDFLSLRSIFLPATAVFVVLFSVTTYFLFRSPDFMEELEEINAIGGFGEMKLNSKEFAKIGIEKLEEHSEQDEEIKNKLLGITSNNSKNSLGNTKGKNKISYKVKPGDTLSHISKKFNISVESIAGSSGIGAPDSISVGQTLKIPPKEGFYYKVKKNERLGDILGKYKVGLGKVLEENPNMDADLLETGDEIFLLGAKPSNLFYGWLIPVNSRIITSGYGWRRWPRRAFHKGLDLKAFYTRVRASKGGVVTFAGRLGGYGKVVVLEHAGGYRTLYAHLSRIYVRKGMRVSQGRSLGKSGNTGYSFGPHLHFEVSRSGKHINPRGLIKGLRYRRKSRR